MPVEPLPCTPGEIGDPTPVEVTTCCAPSIASTALCRDNGTTVLLVVRSGCAECGEAAPDPEAIGWIDAASGTFTGGPPPADAGPCDAGCVDTVCRQLCDDTDGDGEADATYSELWCIHEDGTANLILTYQSDPSVPYVPISPVECTYGCPESETVTLCDDAGPFLRRYTFLAGTATFEDVDLDGQTPHVVTGTVGACTDTGSPCPEPTTPMATAGLCLPDGTPLAVVMTRDCGGQVTQNGWINLATGQYSTGPPPAGAAACGDSRAFELAGLLCDVDPATGDVYGLVLVEYAYNPDGSLASVRLVDPATGATYTLQGELRNCPAGTGEGQPEQDAVVLCDTDPATGQVTPFVRDYARDENGTITGHSDYTLDGAPHTPAGVVGLCTPEPCRNCESVVLCDVPGEAAVLFPGNGGTLDNGVTYTQTGAHSSVFGPGTPVWWNIAATIADPAGAMTVGFGQPVNVRWSVRLGSLGGVDGCLILPAGAAADIIDPAHTWDPATRTLCAAGSTIDAQTSTFHIENVTSLVFVGDPPSDPPGATGRRVGDMWVQAVTPDATTFLRTTCRDCDGTVVSVTDAQLDGGAAYTPSGVVGLCAPAPGPAEPCRDASTLLVCDVPADGVTGTPAAADTDPTPYPWDAAPVRCVTPLAGGGAALWSGGSLTFGPDTAGACNPRQVLRGVAATLTAPRPACDDGTATVTVQVRVTDDGPYDAAANFNGAFRLHRADTGERLAGATLYRTVVGQPEVLTVQASVPAGLLAAGQVVAVLDLETYDDTDGNLGTVWTADQFTAAFAYDVAGCALQFLRTVVTDCDTGQVLAVTDAAMDGSGPYTVTGQVGQCVPAGGGQPEDPVPCRDTTSVLLCDVAAGTETVSPEVADATLAETHLAGVAAFPPLPKPWAALWAGGQLVFPADADGTAGDGRQVYRTVAGRATGTVSDECAAASGELTISVRVTNDGPNPGSGGDGWLWVYRDGVLVRQVSVTHSAPVGHVQTLTATVPVTSAELTGGTIVFALGLETYHVAGPKSWTADQFTISAELDGCAVQFLRTLAVDCATGQVIQVSDTTLSGAPYAVTGEVGQCTPAGTAPEPCQQCETFTLCDSEGAPVPAAVAAADTPFVPSGAGQRPLPGGGAALWTGGTLPFPAESGPPADGGDQTQVYRGIAATVTAVRPDCDDGTATVTSSVHITHTASTGNGFGVTGTYRLMLGGVEVDHQNVPAGTVVGYQATLTVTGQVPAADLAAGLVTAELMLETWQSGDEQGWEADTFTAGAEFGGCPTPFWRTVCRTCDGAVVSTTDTALGGDAPYTLLGEAVQCAAPAGEVPREEPVSTLVECRCDDGDGDGTADTDYVEVITVAADGTLSTVGTYLPDLSGPYEPVAPVACPVGGAPAPELDAEPVLLCDVADDGTVTPFLRHVRYNGAGETVAAYATALDGVTGYTPAGAVGVCGDRAAAPCARQVLERCGCDTLGTGEIIPFTELWAVDPCDAAAALVLLGTYRDGDPSSPYTPVNPGECPASADDPEPLNTGVRNVVGTTVQDLAVEFPGLQSVTVTVVSGDTLVSMSDGTNVSLPAGISLTWSVVKDGDEALTAASFAGADAGSRYVLNFTYQN